ncbi:MULTISPECIES: hypothetical protein [unclassified Streptomyces]|uniref:hypothetical protein n=1 Tax=unclassified Streptomyces TaxID=2593676 RepID=UPI00081D7083|nr:MULTISPECIES: hypothetical protein [unclassified Streptomyces]MYR25155.1 hypothetical protein [Streptomyces sp. SID4945]SCE75127.1 hypothetical protein GA0115257_101744 [Streptomyces sp. LcepLS]
MTTKRKTPPMSVACEVCQGSGVVAVAVRVGRKRRVVGKQDGMCLTCFGSGEATPTTPAKE